MQCTSSECPKRIPAELEQTELCLSHLGSDGVEKFLIDRANEEVITLTGLVLDDRDIKVLLAAVTKQPHKQGRAGLKNKQLMFSNASIVSETETAWPDRLARAFKRTSFFKSTFHSGFNFTGHGRDTNNAHYFSFGDCTVVGRLTFREAELSIVVEGSRLHGAVLLEDVDLLSYTRIDDCYMGAWFDLRRAVVKPGFRMTGGNRVRGRITFEEVEAESDIGITLTNCRSLIWRNCRLGSQFELGNIEVQEEVGLHSVDFGHDANIVGLTSLNFISAVRCSFGDRTELTMTAKNHVSLYDSTFTYLANLGLASEDVRISQCRFSGGTIRLDARNATFKTFRNEESMTILSATILSTTSEIKARNRRSAIAKFANADLSKVALLDIDLASCTFAEVTNLDQVELQGDTRFGDSTGRLAVKRQILNAERKWRERNTLKFGSAACFPSIYRGTSQSSTQARELEAQYRRLRKGLEDGGNQPGAADFYYGEMEMRRRGTDSAWEKAILILYWLVSGYGLRAWRAIAALLLTLAVASATFATVGFKPAETQGYIVQGIATTTPTISPQTFSKSKPGVRDSVTYTIRSASTFSRPGNPPALTAIGEITDLLVRILSPILIALAALAVRARVKR